MGAINGQWNKLSMEHCNLRYIENEDECEKCSYRCGIQTAFWYILGVACWNIERIAVSKPFRILLSAFLSFLFPHYPF